MAFNWETTKIKIYQYQFFKIAKFGCHSYEVFNIYCRGSYMNAWMNELGKRDKIWGLPWKYNFLKYIFFCKVMSFFKSCNKPFITGTSEMVEYHAIMGICNCSMFCCALLCVHSSFAIILRDSWLLCFVCLPGVSWLLCGSSRGARGLSAFCDCDISWSYSLFLEHVEGTWENSWPNFYEV